ncbi:hypothetical protein [Streptomyces collinus]
MRPSTSERDHHPLTVAPTGTPPATGITEAGITAVGAARAIRS